MQLSNEERAQLAGTFGCTVDELGRKLKTYEAAALEEYITMILGQKVFTRGSDIREYRLYLLVKKVYGGVLPSEQQISSHFQLTASQSRALLRAVMSKYQYELRDEVEETLRRALSGSVERSASESRVFTPESENIIDSLNSLLGSIDGNLSPISRVRNSVNTFEIDKESYDALAANLTNS